MNNGLIIALVAVALVILILVLRKSSAKKAVPPEPAEEEVSSGAQDEPTEPEIESEPESAAVVEEETVAEEAAQEPETETAAEEIEAEDKKAEESETVEEVEEPVAEEPVAAEDEKTEEPEPVEEVEEPVTAEEEPEDEKAAAAEELDAEAVAEVEETEEPEVEPVEEPVQEESAPVPTAALTVEAYEQRLSALKDKQLAALTEAIDNNEESRRERLQVELVAITESLTFLNQGYQQEISCRTEARQALDQMQALLDNGEYEEACASLNDGDTEPAETLFDRTTDADSEFSAMAAYQAGRLAECRIDFTQAMDRLEKAVTLEGDNPDYLRAAALLARKLYKHKQALAWFTTLEQVLAEQGEDTVELALARRELAYASALVSQHKKAGGLYKQAMVSLTKLLGKDDHEMGICWLQIGKLQEALGQYEKAEDPYKKALAVLDTAEDNPALGEILDKLAGLYMELEREMDAVPLFERLCAFKEASPNPDNATLAMTYGNLGEAYRICGKYEESEQKYMRALTLTEELRGKDHAAVGSVLQELAQLCERQGKKEEAQAYRDRAAAIFQRVLEEQEAAGQEGVKFDL